MICALNDGINDAYYLMALDVALLIANSLTPIALIVIRFTDLAASKQKWAMLVAMCSSQKKCCPRKRSKDPPIGEREDLPPSMHSIVSWGVKGPLPSEPYDDVEKGSGIIAVFTPTTELPEIDEVELTSFNDASLPPPPVPLSVTAEHGGKVTMV